MNPGWFAGDHQHPGGARSPDERSADPRDDEPGRTLCVRQVVRSSACIDLNEQAVAGEDESSTDDLRRGRRRPVGRDGNCSLHRPERVADQTRNRHSLRTRRFGDTGELRRPVRRVYVQYQRWRVLVVVDEHVGTGRCSLRPRQGSTRRVRAEQGPRGRPGAECDKASEPIGSPQMMSSRRPPQESRARRPRDPSPRTCAS